MEKRLGNFTVEHYHVFTNTSDFGLLSFSGMSTKERWGKVERECEEIANTYKLDKGDISVKTLSVEEFYMHALMEWGVLPNTYREYFQRHAAPCPACGGFGWVTGIEAVRVSGDGEPEPRQCQEHCAHCSGTGIAKIRNRHFDTAPPRD